MRWINSSLSMRMLGILSGFLNIDYKGLELEKDVSDRNRYN